MCSQRAHGQQQLLGTLHNCTHVALVTFVECYTPRTTQAVTVEVEPDDLSATKAARPTQPTLAKFPQTVFGDQKRAFSSSLYERFSFIEYSVKCDAVYCFTCRHFPSRFENAGAGAYTADPAFTKCGYRDWKRIHTALTKHSVSDSHMQATAYLDAWRSSERTGSVVSKVEDYANKVIEKNRDVVSTLARIGLFCDRRGLALRGHRESCVDPSINKGNFLSLVQLMELENVEFKDKLKTLPPKCKVYF